MDVLDVFDEFRNTDGELLPDKAFFKPQLDVYDNILEVYQFL